VEETHFPKNPVPVSTAVGSSSSSSAVSETESVAFEPLTLIEGIKLSADVLAVLYAPSVEAIFVACANRQVCVFQNSAREGRFTQSLLLKSEASVHSLAWDAGRRLLWCGCSNGVIYAYKFAATPRFSSSSSPSLLLSVRFTEPCNVIALWHDGVADLVVAVSKHGELMLFDLERKLKRVRKLSLDGSSVRAAAFDRVSHRLFVATSQRITLFDFALRRLALIYGHQAKIEALEFSATKCLLYSLDKDGLLGVWNIGAVGAEKQVAPLHMLHSASGARSMVWCGQVNLLCTAGRARTVVRWQISDQEGGAVHFRSTAPCHENTIIHMRWIGSESVLLTVCRDRVLKLWQLTGGSDEQVETLNAKELFLAGGVPSPVPAKREIAEEPAPDAGDSDGSRKIVCAPCDLDPQYPAPFIPVLLWLDLMNFISDQRPVEVKMLVSSKMVTQWVDVNAGDRHGTTPLHVAAGGESGAIPSILLRHNANPNARNVNEQIPLHLVRYTNATAALLATEALSALVSVRDKFGCTPLHLASRDCVETEVIGKLIRAGASVNAVNRSGATPLFFALKARTLHLSTVQTLLERGAHVNVCAGPKQETPLHLVVEKVRLATCIYSDSSPGDPMSASSPGSSASPASSVTSAAPTAAASPTTSPVGSTTVTGITASSAPLSAILPSTHTSSSSSSSSSLTTVREVLKLLLKQGADPNCADTNGNTPLHLAVATEERGTVRLLLKANASLLAVNARGLYPHQMCSRQCVLAGQLKQLFANASANAKRAPPTAPPSPASLVYSSAVGARLLREVNSSLALVRKNATQLCEDSDPSVAQELRHLVEEIKLTQLVLLEEEESAFKKAASSQ